MSKAQKGNKEEKKQPLLSAKQKRAAKHLKKELRDGGTTPFRSVH